MRATAPQNALTVSKLDILVVTKNAQFGSRKNKYVL